MTYQGSKEKLADEIVEILKAARKPNQLYWEPFLGSAPTFVRMSGPKLGTDAMGSLIMLWNAVIDGTFIEPERITKEEYDAFMSAEEHSAMRAYAGFFWSFSGMYAKGWSPDYNAKSRSFHSMQSIAKKLREQQKTSTVLLRHADYRLPDISNALIYCDPPYIGTTTYRGTEPFDHDEFYDWCRKMKTKGNTLFISEYWMPEDRGFFCIHEFPYRTVMQTLHRESEKPEKIYTL